MDITYKVFSAHRKTVQTVAVVSSGEEVNAVVESFDVQLVPKDPALHGTIKLEFIGTNAISEAEALFKIDAEVVANYVATPQVAVAPAPKVEGE